MNELKTINIKGRPYVTVNERIKAFRGEFSDNINYEKSLSLETEIVELNEKFVVLRALIKNSAGRIIATGLAREVNGDTYINKTSYVENAETSAWGRALGNLGIGIDASIASAEEVINAINNQEPELHNEGTFEIVYQDVKKGIENCGTLKALETYWLTQSKRLSDERPGKIMYLEKHSEKYYNMITKAKDMMKEILK